MCRGVAPSCHVHSLLREHHPVAVSRPGYVWGYAKGCHACEALVDEHGETPIMPWETERLEAWQASRRVSPGEEAQP